MKDVVFIFLLAIFAVGIGEVDATMRHAGDYRIGYDRGFAAGHEAITPAPVDARVTNNLLCYYADLVCAKSKAPKCPSK